MKQAIKRLHYEGIIHRHKTALAARDKDYENYNPIFRASRAIELIDLGVDFEENEHGFVVDTKQGKILIAAIADKYCYFPRYKWYWMRDVKTLINKLNS